MNNSAEETRKYLKQHKIDRLMQLLTSLAAFHQPEDPYAFFSESIQKLQQRDFNASMLFSETDLHALFGKYDVLKKGVLSGVAVNNALADIGATAIDNAPATVTEADFVSLVQHYMSEYYKF